MMQNTIISDGKKFTTSSASDIVPVKIQDDYKAVAGGSIHDFMFQHVGFTAIPEDQALYLSYYGLTSYTFKKVMRVSFLQSSRPLVIHKAVVR